MLIAIVRVGKACGYIVSIFIGAMIAALIAGYVTPFLPGHSAWTPRRVQDVAWIAGALIMAIGLPLGWVRISTDRFRTGTNPAADAPAAAPPAAPSPPDRTLAYTLRAALFMGMVGTIAGLIAGGTLAIVWLSISMGPLAPAEWMKSIRVAGGGVSTSNPIPFALWFGTAGALAVLGFLFGLVAAPRGWLTVDLPKRSGS
jgi:hypothetical protein